jgi:hypothetical protein
VNALVARNAIQAVGRIALRLPARANICVDKLISLLVLDIDYVTSETLVVMTSELGRGREWRNRRREGVRGKRRERRSVGAVRGWCVGEEVLFYS